VRIVAAAVGVLGALIGMAGANSTLQLGQLEQALRVQGASALIGSAVLAMLSSIVGIVGGGVALTRPGVASVLMTLAALCGIATIRSAYLVAAAVLLGAAMLAYLSRTPPLPSGSVAQLAPSTAPLAPVDAPFVARSAPASSAGKRNWMAIAAWSIGVVLTATTWWFFLFAFFILTVCGLLAWIPDVGRSVLRALGWRSLPGIGGFEGWQASLVLLGLAVAALVIAGLISPRPPT
jgi:hypothetical protein